jgi:hypothetical protein
VRSGREHTPSEQSARYQTGKIEEHEPFIMEDVMNVVELAAWRKDDDKRNRELVDAVIYGATNNKYAKDPSNPAAPGEISRFFAHCCEENPILYMQLLSKLLTNNE